MTELIDLLQDERVPFIEARDSLLLFTQRTRPRYRANWHHAELARKLDRVARGECKRLMVFLPPQHSWPLYGITTGGVPKISRIRRLSQYIVNRNFRFRADSPGCRLLVDQLMDFPHADHDDGPDAIEMCVRLALEAYGR
jgi:hypothetical protein